MNTVALAALVAAIAIATAATTAVAQSAGGAAKLAPWVQTGDAAYPPPPDAPPAGTHYEWIFSYDHHGNYLGHWQVVRDN